MKNRFDRRRFLAGTTAAAGALVLSDSRSAFSYAANERLNVALIGVGGRGRWFVDTIPRMENVTALCDVNSQKLDEAFKHWEEAAARYAESPNDWERKAAQEYKRLAKQRPKTFRDFRRMFDESGKEIDAVVVATPDHTHAVASAAAMRAGKHVFCEKPLTRTLHESRALRDLARECKVATSMGNQGTASAQFRRALELIRGGTLGEIKEVHVWNTGGGSDRQEPPGEQPVPDYLDWDLWLGPAKMRPFHSEWLRRNAWRDFGTCQLGNWASHSANLAFMALKVHDLWLGAAPAGPAPLVRIRATTSGINRLSFPKWEVIDWEIPPRGDLPAITFRWYNGNAARSQEVIVPMISEAGGPPAKLDHAGAVIVGTKGTLHATGHNATFRLLPGERFADVEQGRPQEVDTSRGQEQDWLIACRGGKPAWANFDYASALNEFLMLGNVATQFEAKLDFDPRAMKIVNHAEADAQLRSEYRPGWKL